MSSPDKMQPSPKKRSRHKLELEPISMDEILAGPGMSGFVGILDPPEKVPHLQALVDDIKDIPLATLSGAALKARAIPETLQGPGLARAPEAVTASAPLPTPDPIIAPEPLRESGIERDTQYSLPRYPVYAPMLNGRYVRRAAAAQDGHSAGE